MRGNVSTTGNLTATGQLTATDVDLGAGNDTLKGEAAASAAFLCRSQVTQSCPGACRPGFRL
jgi:hypothetical protein